jgi:hAT family C-terminal dimerisation region
LKEDNPQDQEYVWLEAAAESAWEKCKHYYNLADDSAAYHAAEVLHPNRKWNWLPEQWGKDPQKKSWLKKTQAAVQKLWEEEYKGKFAMPSVTSLSQLRDRNPDGEFGALAEHQKIKKPGLAIDDPYLSYIDRDLETGEESLDYWDSRLVSRLDLARFALDMLAIPASSAECERIFSSAKILITASWNRLHPDVIEANECLETGLGSRKKSTSRAWTKTKTAGCAGAQLLVRSAIMRRVGDENKADEEGKRDDNEDTGSVEAYSDSERINDN